MPATSSAGAQHPIARPEQPDIKLVVDAVTRLVPFGLRVARSDRNDMIGLPEPDDDATILAAPAPTPSATPAEDGDEDEDGPGDDRDPDAAAARQAAERPQRDAIDLIAEVAERWAAPASDALIDTIRALVLNADSLADVRDGLLRLRPQMPAAELARHLQAALAYAELTGRADIADG